MFGVAAVSMGSRCVFRYMHPHKSSEDIFLIVFKSILQHTSKNDEIFSEDFNSLHDLPDKNVPFKVDDVDLRKLLVNHILLDDIKDILTFVYCL